MADIAFVVDYSDIQTTRRELLGVAKDAKSSASVFEREFAKAERILTKSAKASQSYYKEVLGLDKASKSAAASASVFSAAIVKTEKELEAARKQIIAVTKQQEAEEDRLRSKYQSGYAELKLYKAANEELNLAFKKNIITEQQLAAEQAKLNTAFASGTGIFSQYAMQSASKAGQLGVITQQAGYQIGDFIVQVQSGTNAFVAFGQQATQMVGFIPMFASAMGVATVSILGFNVAIAPLTLGLSIAIPLITAFAAAFTRSKGSVADLKKPLEEAVELTKKLREESEKIRFPDQTTRVVDDLKQKLAEAKDRLDSLKKSFSTNTPSTFGSAFGQAVALEAGEEDVKNAENVVLALQEEIRLHDLIVQRENAKNAEASAYLAKQKQIKEEQEKLAEKVRYGKDLFHLLAGETESVSFYLSDALKSAYGLSQVNFGNMHSLSGFLEVMSGMGGRGQPATSGPRTFVGGVLQDPRSPLQIYEDFVASMERGARGRGFPASTKATVDTKTGGSGGGQAQTQEEYIQQLLLEDEQKRRLIGLSQSERTASEEEFKIREKLRDLKGNVTEEEIQATLRQMDATQKLIEQQQRVEAITKSFSSTIENAFMSIADGSKTVADAFRNMLRDMLLEIYRQQIVKPMADSFAGFLGGLFQANGGVWNKGIQMYANGGVVGSPTMFRHAGGIGMMGEAGPEAIMPLKRGKNGKLGVQVDGGGSVNVVQHFNFSANGDDSVKKIIAQAAPQIAQMTQKQIMDSRRRGGSMKATFG